MTSIITKHLSFSIFVTNICTTILQFDMLYFPPSFNRSVSWVDFTDQTQCLNKFEQLFSTFGLGLGTILQFGMLSFSPSFNRSVSWVDLMNQTQCLNKF